MVLKILSRAPEEYEDAPAEGIRRILSIAEGKEIPKGTLIDLARVESIRMGTTVATKYVATIQVSNSGRIILTAVSI